MSGKLSSGSGNPAQHFGRQMQKARKERGWTLADLARETGINMGHLSRIENGKRPPTEKIALACDEVFQDRKGWFLEYYAELQGWSEVPAAFKDWSEHEVKAVNLRVWQPGIVDGFLQTEDYSRGLFEVSLDASPEIMDAWVRSRTQRQRHVLFRREDPPQAVFAVDEVSLYRLIGSPEIMAAQMQHLIDIARLPHVTLQVLPLVAHCANASNMIITDDAAYAEHQAGGYVFTDERTVYKMTRQFDTLRGECYRVSETLALLGRMRDTWARGVNPLTARAGEGPASK